MLYKTLSAAVYGIDASIIEVEVDVSGIKTMEDHFHTVGLPDAAVRESRDRVRAALKNCGYDIPPTHITINLAPADIVLRHVRFTPEGRHLITVNSDGGVYVFRLAPPAETPVAAVPPMR